MAIRVDKIITIQKLVGTKENANGFQEEIWDDYRKAMASVNNLYGKEFWSAKAVNSENTIEFITRYTKELSNIDTKDYRIAYNNKNYDIVFIDNIKHQNGWLKIKGFETS